jgi:Domain of unknown function (DUF1874)
MPNGQGNRIMAKFLVNAFSLNMLSADAGGMLYHRFSANQARDWVGFYSPIMAIGHGDTATLVNNQLGTDRPHARVTVQMESGDSCVVAQYKGPRLAEGTTVLPEGATIEYFLVTIN